MALYACGLLLMGPCFTPWRSARAHQEEEKAEKAEKEEAPQRVRRTRRGWPSGPLLTALKSLGIIWPLALTREQPPSQVAYVANARRRR